MPDPTEKRTITELPFCPPRPADPFADHVLHAMPPELKATFSRPQLEAIQRAVEKTRGASRHLIDVRGVIPLFFTSLYFVFLLGKDRRRSTLQVLAERRRTAGQGARCLATAAFLLAAVLCLALLAAAAFVLLYAVKWLLGIDIFPGARLGDFLGL